MCKRKNYEKYSFYKLWKFARHEKDQEEKQKIYGFAIGKLSLSDEEYREFAVEEWGVLSTSNRILLKERIEELAGATHNYVYESMHKITGENYWLERNADGDFKFSLLIAKTIPETQHGLHAYNQCIEMIASNKWQSSMNELITLYKLGGTGQKLLWDNMNFLLDFCGAQWHYTIPEVAKTTNRIKAIMRWIATLKNSSDWAKFLKECPPKWRHLACREASAYYLRLSKIKNLKDQDL